MPAAPFSIFDPMITLATRLMIRKQILLIIPLICISMQTFGTTYYVALEGSDSAPGTFAQPFAKISMAVGLVSPGDTIMVRGGRYDLLNLITISSSGTSESYCTLMAYPEEHPILDFSSQDLGGSNRGIKLSGSYWRIEGLDITGAGDNGMKIDGGSYNEILNCAFYRNRDSGLQMGNGASYNRVINCDSYYNADPPDYGDADGFAAKLDVGIENYFYGCRAWKNCDDGWDGYMRGADNVSTIIENSWAFENGYLEDGTDPGPSANGNGFKLGGSDNKLLRHDYRLTNCLAFKNKSKGFDQNSNMGTMILLNCTGHNNLGNNYSLYKELAAGEEAVIKNCAVLGEPGAIGDFVVQQANSWLGIATVAADDFVSIDDESAYGPRQADGSLPEIPYMYLVENSDMIDAGVSVGLPFEGMAPDLGCFEFSPITALQNNTVVSSSLDIFPNPAKDLIWIKNNGRFIGELAINVVDVCGRQINQSVAWIDPGNGKFSFEISELDQGMYVLTVTDRSGRTSGLFMVD